MNRLPFLGALAFCAVMQFSPALAQVFPAGAAAVPETLRIANYNLLNYPGSDAATRNPYFRRVVHTMRPDILVVQEMTSSSGVTNYLNNVLNFYTPGLYSTITFHDGYDTDNHIFFKSSKVAFIDALYLTTELRDIAGYRVRVLGTNDTLRLYSLHLKASSGPPNGTLRYNEATILRNHLNALPAGTQFLVMGDFNAYASSDSGLIPLFRSEADNDGRCKDPINRPGSWNDNGAFDDIHTQSPRVRAFGGGSTGGMDDRFDMILTPMHAGLDDNILASTYKAYGNDGNHLNDSINKLPNTAVPDSVAHGLHYSSDHIPVFCDFVFSGSSVPAAFAQTSPSNGAANQAVSGSLSWQAAGAATGYDVYLDTNAVPATLVSSDQPGTSYGYSGLLNSTQYRWKVVARNTFGTTDATGSPWSFTTVTAVPGAFTLDTPADSAVDLLPLGLLTWHPATGAAGYDVYLDMNDPPTTLVEADVTDTSYAYSGLAPGSVYRWNVTAKNPGGSTPAGDGPRQFTTLAAPAAVAGLAAGNITTASLDLSWTDVATDEDGYRVYRSASPGGPFSQIGTDMPPGTSAFSDSNLSLNTRYYYRVVPFNVAGEGAPGAVSPATLAVPPGVPVLSGVGGSSMRVTLNPLANPSGTQFAIRLNSNGSDLYVQTNGTTSAASAWQTYAQWGGASGFQVTGLAVCSTYIVTARARNLDELETAESDTAGATLLCASASASVSDGWNLLSVPVTVPDRSTSVLFPASTTPAYAYEGSYVAEESLRYGAGYWLKFSGDQQVGVDGDPRLLDSIPVTAGWNLVGSVSQPVPVAAASSVPPGILTSNFFSYAGAYAIADTIRPLVGYWVKASAAGQLVLDAAAAAPLAQAAMIPAAGVCELTLRDAGGRVQQLTVIASGTETELPPVPVAGAFDARFSRNRRAVVVPAGSSSAVFAVRLQAGRWPVTAEWKAASGYRASLLVGNAAYGPGSVVIESPGEELRLQVDADGSLPASVKLYQNYPNPFNPATDIRYDLPADALVKLTIYSILGEVTEVLLDGPQPAGSRSVTWRPAGSSGIYVCRLQAAALDGSFSVSETRLLNYLK